jgi:methyl-accepting chemotaxis protein
MNQKNSLLYRIGASIIVIEVATFILLGFVLIGYFSNQQNNLFKKQLESPAILMSQGQLRYEAAVDAQTLQKMIGDTIFDCMVVGANNKVYYSLNPSYNDKHINDIPNIQHLAGMEGNLTQAEFVKTADGMVGIAPLYFTNGKTLGYFYIYSSTSVLEKSKVNLIILVGLGALVSIVLSSVIIILLFNRNITTKIKALLGIIEELENGNLNHVATTTFNNDELGRLYNAIDKVNNRFASVVNNINGNALELLETSAKLNNDSLQIVGKCPTAGYHRRRGGVVDGGDGLEHPSERGTYRANRENCH